MGWGFAALRYLTVPPLYFGTAYCTLFGPIVRCSVALILQTAGCFLGTAFWNPRRKITYNGLIILIGHLVSSTSAAAEA